MKGKLLFLGTGASMGVPKIACDCPVCSSNSYLNKRLRTSALLTINDKKILIDVGPDFREQSLKYSIHHLDGILLTHVHYDHIAGIDELRAFFLKTKKKLPCLLSQESLDELKIRYHYLFQPMKKNSTLSAQIDFQPLPLNKGNIPFLGLNFEYLSYSQGPMKVTGYRLGSLAYITDIKEYSEEIFHQLNDLDVLILSALRYKKSPIQFNIQEAVDFAKKVNAKKTWLIHIDHDLDHEETNKSLPSNIELAQDGLEINFQYEKERF